MKLYVSYGSNLNMRQMSHRCPTARVYGTGKLHDWQLIYRGSKSGAYATIRPMAGFCVPVTIWVIQPLDEYRLDIYEGYPNFYSKENITVEMPWGSIEAMVYIMDLNRKPGAPSQAYVDTLREGYEDNNLDLTYLYESLAFNSCELKKTFQREAKTSF